MKIKRTTTLRGSMLTSMWIAGALLTRGAVAYPTVFPEGVTIHSSGVAEGHMLFSAQTGFVYLIDSAGTVLHTWQGPCGFSGAVRPLADGHVLMNSCGNMVELDWDSQVVWQAPPPGDCVFHHDWERLENGNTLAMCLHTIDEPALSTKPLIDDFLVELAPNGDVVWEWHLVDHLDELVLSQDRLDYISEVGGDYSHGNTLIVIPESTPHSDPRFRAGNVFLSFRHLNTITIVDPATGDIVWSLTDVTVGQHSPHIIPGDLPGGGNVLVFDNGFAGNFAVLPNRGFSRVLELDPLTKFTVSAYTADLSQDVPPHQGPLSRFSFFAPFTSGAQRLENGNTFIAEGPSGRMFEITPASQIVWEYVNPFRGATNNPLVFRPYKVSFDFAGSSFSPDLVVSGDAPGPALAGQPLSYSVSVANAGAEPAIDARLVVTTPPGTTFDSVVVPAGWDCSTPPPGATGAIHCTTRNLSGGAGAQFTLTVEVGFCFRDGGPILASFSASSDGSDAAPADNTLMLQSIAEGIDCDDGVACTMDGCDPSAEQCIHVSSCGATGDPCLAPFCNPSTGSCELVPAPIGTACDDDDPATCADQCSAGVCGGTFVPEPPAVNDSVRLGQTLGTTAIGWADAPGGFNVYGGSMQWPDGLEYTHECLNPAGPLGTMSFGYAPEPPPGSVIYFLVTRVDQCRESTPGPASDGSPRPNPYPCGAGSSGP